MGSIINGEGKSIADSATVLTLLISPDMANFAGTAHGGELLKLMDNTGAVCAVRHSRAIVTTAAVDEVKFLEPLLVSNLAICHAHLTYVGRSSMEVAVSIEAEDLMAGNKRCCLTAYYVYVALDKDLKPAPVSPLVYRDERERQIAAEAEARMKRRKDTAKVCWLPLY